MSRMVFCQVLKREATGLETPPYPGELGERIFENISEEGWKQWLDRLTTIINENRLSTEKHMIGFLFGEGDFGQLPQGFVPPGQKK